MEEKMSDPNKELERLIEELNKNLDGDEAEQKPSAPANDNAGQQPDKKDDQTFQDSGFDDLNRKLQELDQASQNVGGSAGSGNLDFVIDPNELRIRQQKIAKMKQDYVAGKGSLKEIFKMEALNMKPIVDLIDQLGGVSNVRFITEPFITGALGVDFIQEQGGIIDQMIPMILSEKASLKAQLPPKEMLPMIAPMLKSQFREQVKAMLTQKLKFNAKMAQEVPFEARKESLERAYDVIAPFLSETKEEFLEKQKEILNRSLEEMVDEVMKLYDSADIVTLYDTIDTIVTAEFVEEIKAVVKETYANMTLDEKRDLINGGITYLYERTKHLEKTGEPYSFKPSVEAGAVTSGLQAAFTKAVKASEDKVDPARRQKIIRALKMLKMVS